VTYWDGDLNCESRNLTSLLGAPDVVDGFFSCSHNKLTSLAGSPVCINGGFQCCSNKLNDLKDIHKVIKKINGKLVAFGNRIEAHILGVLLIAGVTEFQIDNEKVTKIVNKHLPNCKGLRGALECQAELIDAGFEDYAQL
jgi:hypothetical protein